MVSRPLLLIIETKYTEVDVLQTVMEIICGVVIIVRKQGAIVEGILFKTLQEVRHAALLLATRRGCGLEIEL